MTPGEIARRPAVDSDRPFLFELYASAREAELAQVPWTPQQKHAFIAAQFEAQLSGYRQTHPGASHDILLLEGTPVGRLYLARLPDRIHILDITIAPAERNRGIGAQVLAEIVSDAERAGLPVTIYVESFNSSLRLFQRLGFEVAVQDGFQLLLEHRPSAAELNRAAPPPAGG